MSTTKQRIAVAGATGRVGHHLVDVLQERGHEVVPMSRSNGIDVVTGEGLQEAVTGVHAIVDVATSPSPEQQAATEFFTTAARNLQRAGDQAGVERIVVVSIVGTDKFTGGYGAAKVAHEQTTLAGPVPALVLRAAQFHEFVEQLMQWGRQDGVTRLSNMRMQPIAARAVAEELAELATASHAMPNDQRISNIAGPREENLIELARLFAAKHGDPVQVEAWSDPSDPDAHIYESGALLPGPDAKLAGPTFQEWLEES
jgi:uncharacterized protein YbjT (DUF2867 family)